MDPEIQELKEMLQKQEALLEDTNHIVHMLRRNVWWGRLWTIVWWGAIVVVSGATYYLYLQPYLEQLQHMYAQFQTSTTTAQTWQQQATDFFKQFMPRQ